MESIKALRENFLHVNFMQTVHFALIHPNDIRQAEEIPAVIWMWYVM